MSERGWTWCSSNRQQEKCYEFFFWKITFSRGHRIYWSQSQSSLGENAGYTLNESPAHRRALTDGRGHHARCQLHIRSKFWGSVSCLRILWHAAQLRPSRAWIRPTDLPITSDLLYLLSYSRPQKMKILTWKWAKYVSFKRHGFYLSRKHNVSVYTVCQTTDQSACRVRCQPAEQWRESTLPVSSTVCDLLNFTLYIILIIKTT